MISRFRSGRRSLVVLAAVALSVTVSTLIAGCTPRPPYPVATDEETARYQQQLSELAPLETWAADLDREIYVMIDAIAQINPEMKFSFTNQNTSSGLCDYPYERTGGQKFGGRWAWAEKAASDEEWHAVAAQAQLAAARLGMRDVTDTRFGVVPGKVRKNLVFAADPNGGFSLETYPSRTHLRMGTGCRFTSARSSAVVTAAPDPRFTPLPSITPTR